MLENIDLTTITACHHSAKFIGMLLTSLNQQMFGDYNIELLFILDHDETDNTEEMINLLIDKEKYKNITIIHSEDTREYAKKQIGKDRASGKYIWFIDSDDWLIYEFGFLTILNFFKAHQDEPILYIEHMSNMFDLERVKLINIPTHDTSHAVWSYVFNAEMIRDIKFDLSLEISDATFSRAVFAKFNLPFSIRSIPRTVLAFYFYNFARLSNQTTKILGLDLLKLCT